MSKKWSIKDDIEIFYKKLWKLHTEGALDTNDDKIASKIINVIDDAMTSVPDKEKI